MRSRSPVVRSPSQSPDCTSPVGEQINPASVTVSGVNLNVIEPWYADGLKFTCTQCGNCCTGGPGYVWMSDVELQRLADHLQMDLQTLLRKHCRKINGRWSLKERRNERGQYDCIFLTGIPGSNARGCGIYQVRPLQCRTWPFWDGNLSDKDSWKASKRVCPGMDKGKHYPLERIEEIRTADDWPYNPPSSK